MSVHRVRSRCGHVRSITLPPQGDGDSVLQLLSALEKALCPVCAEAKERHDERRYVSCPE